MRNRKKMSGATKDTTARTILSLALAGLCLQKVPSSILNNNRFHGDAMKAFAYLCSDPAGRSPPRCHSDLTKTHIAHTVRHTSGAITCTGTCLFTICRCYSVQWIEFIMLTPHPKTPDRTAAEAGRHVSRNIHNTGNFASCRENTDSESQTPQISSADLR